MFSTGTEIPSIAINSHETGDDSEASRESFQDMMKNNLPSVARIPSPKPHRKHHHHHHHHHGHRHHKPKSPVFSANGNDEQSPFLFISDNDTSHSRLRSKSDSQIGLNMNSLSSSLLRQAVHTRQKSRTEDDCDDIFNIKLPSLDGKDVKDGDNTTTLSRDIIGEAVEGVDENAETLTKRREELTNEIEKSKSNLSKKRTLKMIDQLLEQCSDNFHHVQRDIELEFKRIHTALDNRKKELIEESRSIRDKKIETLKQSKRDCLKSKSVLSISSYSPLNSSDNDSDNGTASSSRRNSGEHDECLQQNGILEPWKSSTNSQEQMQKTIGNAFEKLKRQENIFSEVLEEGNASFVFNEESLETISSIGQIKCSLSSPQFSFVKGLQFGIALVGETVHFEVHTKSFSNEASFNSKDQVNCEIFNLNGETMEAQNRVTLHRSLSNGRVISPACSHSTIHRFYTYNFTPQVAGKYEIRISINNVELKSSPISYSVFPKVNLAFDLKSPEERKEINLVHGNSLEKRRQTMSKRQSSEESDWMDQNWIVQKGDKSSILRSVDNVPSYIYASPSVKGFCAWKIRVTSACESISVSVGVGTHSGIPDIDEHFSCDFKIKPSSQKKINSIGGRMQVRRTSSFTRISIMYDVLLSSAEGIVRVICEQNEEDKVVRIDPELMERFELYPFISMIHKSDMCQRQVCPRPQITLL